MVCLLLHIALLEVFLRSCREFKCYCYRAAKVWISSLEFLLPNNMFVRLDSFNEESLHIDSFKEEELSLWSACGFNFYGVFSSALLIIIYYCKHFYLVIWAWRRWLKSIKEMNECRRFPLPIISAVVLYDEKHFRLLCGLTGPDPQLATVCYCVLLLLGN